jgi:hypothetical protein
MEGREVNAMRIDGTQNPGYGYVPDAGINKPKRQGHG